MKSDKTRICLELPRHLYEEIKIIANSYNLSATAYIRLSLQRGIQNGNIRETLV